MHSHTLSRKECRNREVFCRSCRKSSNRRDPRCQTPCFAPYCNLRLTPNHAAKNAVITRPRLSAEGSALGSLSIVPPSPQFDGSSSKHHVRHPGKRDRFIVGGSPYKPALFHKQC